MEEKIKYRLANQDDHYQLAEMRWDFRMEEGGTALHSKGEFEEYFADFLMGAEMEWTIWVAALARPSAYPFQLP